MLKPVTLQDGGILHAGFRRAPRPTRQWLVLLPESGSGLMTGTKAELEELLGPRLSGQFHFLVVNKTGLSRQGKSLRVFEEAFRRKKRIEHARAAMSALIPRGDKIFLVGYSEGAYLAPEIAMEDRRVKRVALIGGGTRGWLKEELGNAENRDKAALRRQIDRIRRSPQSTEKWNGFSYATWHSYRGDDTVQALRQLDIPIHAILGAKDRTIDLNATLRDLHRLARDKADVHVELLSRCGHSFGGHWPAVRRFLEHAVSL
jgi:pimeloyl-ACP methyl ester carboxylesterase